MKWLKRAAWVLVILAALGVVYLASAAAPWFGQ